MEITGKVHCFFEQSGTFKNEFIKLGFPAENERIDIEQALLKCIEKNRKRAEGTGDKK